MAVLTLRAFAKVNLGLRIVKTRADGFHDLRTIFQTIDLHDRIRFETRRGRFEVRCKMPGVPTDRTNLVWKAAQQLWSAAGRDGEPRGVVVTIDKQIPMQAGLGGGSSDAAAALVGLRRVWKLAVDPDEVRASAARLGSDVPYFLIGGTALGLGRGEEVFPLEDLPRRWVVLAVPSFGVPTREAYAWWDDKRGREGFSRAAVENPSRPLLSSLFPGWMSAGSFGNDFEAPVFERYPVLRHLKEQLQEAGAVMAALSGSGSAVFGVFASGSPATAAARKLGRAGADARVTRFRPRKMA